MRYVVALLVTASFLFAWDKAFAETVTTGNLLPNAGDGVDWNSSSTDQINSANSSGYVSNNSTLNGFDITCPTAQSNCGYKYSVGGDFEVTGTATVTADNIDLTTNSITQSMLDNGITLNSHIDVANCESTQGNCESKGGSNDSHTTTIVLKDSSGNILSTTSQTRTEVTGFQGNCNGYPGTTTTGVTASCGQYNDRIIYLGIGANKVDWSWSGTDSNYSNQSRQGPNLLGSSLKMTYNNQGYNPLPDEDIFDDINDTIDDIPIEDDWYDDSWEYMPEDDWSWQDDYVIIEDDIYMEDFEDFEEFEEYDMEMEFEDFDNEFNVVTIEEFEEFEITEFEEPGFEFFEETNFDMAPPDDFFEEDYGDVEIIEEIFEEEFEEEFTAFLEESGMAEEFEAFLEEEGMTEQEFFEEIAEEEFNDELTEESFEEIDEPLENSPTEEESLQEVAENETEAMEPEQMEEPASETKQEDNVAKNESEPEESEQEEPQEKESDSASTEDTEVQSEEDGEQETVQQEMDSKDGIATNVAKIESKVNKNLKNVAKQIAKIVKQNTKNLTKEELFFKNNEGLSAYANQDFYKSKRIYKDNLDLFETQVDLGAYSMEIYVSASLTEYTGSDPIQKRIEKLDFLSGQKAAIMLELKVLKQQ